MLLNSVILVLREVLEAAVLVSVLLALSLNMRLRVSWLWWSVAFGVAGTLWFASALDGLTDALDGAGQEVANAGLQMGVYCLALGIVAACAPGISGGYPPRAWVRWLMALAVTCTVVREGAEILIYVTGFIKDEDVRAAVFAGSAIGAGIGLSLGILFFACLRAMRPDRSQAASLWILCLIGAGMVMQATLLLEQANWLPAGRPLWDSSSLLSEKSIPGELMYAVFGYESTPSALQVGIYLICLGVMASVWIFSVKYRKAGHAA